MKQPDLVELLSALEGQGRKDSTGVFTVDVRKLLPKLADYQLSRPEDYALKLVQAAVAGSASFINVACYGHYLEIEFDGTGLAQGELEQLFAYVFEDQRPARHLRHLAVGVTSALSHQARWVQVESRGRRRRWSMLELEDTVRARPTRNSGLTRVTVARRLGQALGHWWEFLGKKDLYQMLTGAEKAMLPEQAALWRACRHCPVRLRVNGRSVNQEVFGPAPMPSSTRLLKRLGIDDERLYAPDHLLVERHLYRDAGAAFGWPARTHAYRRDRLAAARHHENLPAGVSCPALLGLRFSLGWPTEFHYYHDGVLVETRRQESSVPGLVALVCADDLTLDLSQFRLVGGPQLQARNRWLIREGLQLAHELKKDSASMPTPRRVLWALDRLPSL